MLDVKATIEVIKQAQRELQEAVKNLESGNSLGAELNLDDAVTCSKTAIEDLRRHARWLNRR